MTAGGPDEAAGLAEVVRVEGGRILAVLAATTGDLQLAEDAVQDAAVAALEVWPRTGRPADPSAWLYVAARRKAIDVVRRESSRGARESAASDLVTLLATDPPAPARLRDDTLRLLFTCCHPALSIEARVALALRTLCGLATDEVARVLLVAEPTMAKRLVRAKQKIATAKIRTASRPRTSSPAASPVSLRWSTSCTPPATTPRGRRWCGPSCVTRPCVSPGCWSRCFPAQRPMRCWRCCC